MQRSWTCLVLAIAVGWLMVPAGSVAQQPVERYSVIKLTSFNDEVEYRVVGTSEETNLVAELKTEAKYIDKAIKMAREEWKARKVWERPFPITTMKPRTMLKIGSSTTKQEEAQKQADNLMEKEQRKLDSKADREADKVKAATTELAKEKLKTKEEREKMVKAGVELFMSKLEELKASGGVVPAANPGGEEKK